MSSRLSRRSRIEVRDVRSLLTVALMLVAGAAFASDHAFSVTVRILPGVRPATLELLADCVEPRRTATTEDTTIRELLEKEYGTADASLRALFLKYNPTLTAEEVPRETDVAFPAAPVWFPAKPVKVPEGSTVSQVAVRDIGAFGPQTESSLRKLNPTIDLDHVEAGAEIRLPYRVPLRTFIVRDDRRGRIAELEAMLRDDPMVLTTRVDKEPLGLVPPVSTFDLASAGECDFRESTSRLPLSGDDVPAMKRLQRAQTIIAVVDSGLPAAEAVPFPFWRNADEDGRVDGEDDDGDGYIDDVVGIDATRETGPLPIDIIEDGVRQFHGVHVLGIACGILLDDEIRAAVQSRLQLMVVKVANRSGSILPADLVNGINYADAKFANVVNLSLEGRDNADLRTAIGNNRRMLFVAAAGNGVGGDGLNLDDQEILPASLSNEFDNVISVAAHDQSGAPACFSNFGSRTVDLAAPGIEVESTFGGADPVRAESGTSQASAYVTLAAALLFSKGVTSPEAIRNRILASTDYEPRLDGFVRSAGRLNVSKAVATDVDLIEMVGGCTIAGQIVGPETIPLAGGATIPFKSVRKIVRASAGPAGRTHLILQFVKGKLQFRRESPILDHLDVRVGGAVVPLAWSEIDDVIPAIERGSTTSNCYPIQHLVDLPRE